MPFNITIDHEATRHNSERSSSSSGGEDDESSSDTGVHLSPSAESQEYSDPAAEEQEGSWDVLYPNDLGPSDSASRPRTSSRQRPIVEAPQPEDPRRASYRRHTHERSRNVPHPRSHRSPPSTDAESVDPHDDWQGDARGLPHARVYPQYATGYPAAQYQTYPSHSIVPANHGPVVPYAYQGYQVAPAPAGPGYFPPAHHPMASPGGAPYGAPGGYFAYGPHGYPMHQPIPQPMPPQPLYHSYPPVYSPPPPQVPTPVQSPPTPSDSSKDDEKFARLEKLLLDQKEEAASKEAKAEQTAAEKLSKASADADRAAEIAAAKEQAAKEAREAAEAAYKAAADKAAADKAAKEAADAEKAAEIAAAKEDAAKEAREKAEEEHKAARDKAEEEHKAAIAAASEPPKEKQKPLKFKDAVGRKFQFPFHLCNTWSGMEHLIKEAFMHVEVIGPHVDQGHYDLLGPQGEILLPNVWDTVVEPDWTITMHMWPMTEEKEEEGLPEEAAIEVIDEELVKKPKKKPKPPPLFGWPKKSKSKGKKK